MNLVYNEVGVLVARDTFKVNPTTQLSGLPKNFDMYSLDCYGEWWN